MGGVLTGKDSDIEVQGVVNINHRTCSSQEHPCRTNLIFGLLGDTATRRLGVDR
jgi:hypothetical protein